MVFASWVIELPAPGPAPLCARKNKDLAIEPAVGSVVDFYAGHYWCIEQNSAFAPAPL
jgi:hypothetical protein